MSQRVQQAEAAAQEATPQLEAAPAELDQWLIDFAGLFRDHLGIEPDRHLDLTQQVSLSAELFHVQAALHLCHASSLSKVLQSQHSVIVACQQDLLLLHSAAHSAVVAILCRSCGLQSVHDLAHAEAAAGVGQPSGRH